MQQKFSNNIFGNLNFNISYNHYGKHLDTHSSTYNTIEMDNRDIIDIKINKELKSGVLFINISNLLNEDYQKPHGYNQNKRGINFGYRFN